MAKQCRDQLTLLTAMGYEEDKWREQDYLAKPLTREEQRRFGQMYAEHIGLVKMFSGRMAKKFWFIESETIFSLADIAFLRACRAWAPERGAFSTCLAFYIEGEIKHWVRDNGFALKAPGRVRDIGSRARRLLQEGMSMEEVCERFEISRDELKEALLATSGLAHDVKGFDLHYSTYPTPWEVLEAEEEAAA
jgi:DNA-directed RNA polymerase specialized sigma subunit